MPESNLSPTAIKDFPPKLQKLAKFIEENYGFKSMKEACELAGVNYESARVLISRYRKKGNDFNQLIYSLLDSRNRNRLTYVDDAIFQKALSGDTQAAKLLYQRVGAIDKGSGGDRTQVNINFINPAPRPEAEVEIVDVTQENNTIQPQHIEDNQG